MEEIIKHEYQLAYLSEIIDSINLLANHLEDRGKVEQEEKFFFVGMATSFVGLGDIIATDLNGISWHDDMAKKKVNERVDAYEKLVEELTQESKPLAFLLPSRIEWRGQMQANKRAMEKGAEGEN